MSARRIAVIAAGGALVIGGAGGAIAAVSSGTDPRKSEDAILADAAQRLNIAPDKLRESLAAAEDAQLDAAVKSGDLTQKQADAIKQDRKVSGAVLVPPIVPGGPIFPHRGPHFRGPLGPGGPGGPGGGFERPGGPGVPGVPGGGFERPGGPRFGPFSDLAKALGLSKKELVAKLRGGQTIGAVAKAQGKSLDDVRAAIKAAATTRADAAVKNGDLTRKQADALLQRLDDHLKNLDRVPHLRLRERRDHRGFGLGGGRPGSFAPPPAEPRSTS